MMVDYIGAGMSPLAYEEYNSLIDLGATIRLVPLVYLPSSNLNKTVIQTYNHHSLLKDFGQYILPDADKLKDNINTHEWVWAFLDKSFIKFMNYPRNPITLLDYEW